MLASMHTLAPGAAVARAAAAITACGEMMTGAGAMPDPSSAAAAAVEVLCGTAAVARHSRCILLIHVTSSVNQKKL